MTNSFVPFLTISLPSILAAFPSPSMDIIIYLTTSNEIYIYRLTSDLLYSSRPINNLTFSPNGRQLLLATTETTPVCRIITLDGFTTDLEWSIPSIPTYFNWFTTSDNDLNLLFLGYANGLKVNLFGDLTILTVSIPPLHGLHYATFDSSLRVLHMICSIDNQFIYYSFTVLNVSSNKSSLNKLSIVFQRATSLLLSIVTHSSAIQKEYAHIQSSIQRHIPHNVTFLHSIAFGKDVDVRRFITHTLTPRGLRKLDNSCTTSYQHILETITLNLIPDCEELVIVLTGIKRKNLFGISRKNVSECLDKVCGMIVELENWRIQIGKEKEQWNSFVEWIDDKSCNVEQIVECVNGFKSPTEMKLLEMVSVVEENIRELFKVVGDVLSTNVVLENRITLCTGNVVCKYLKGVFMFAIASENEPSKVFVVAMDENNRNVYNCGFIKLNTVQELKAIQVYATNVLAIVYYDTLNNSAHFSLIEWTDTLESIECDKNSLELIQVLNERLTMPLLVSHQSYRLPSQSPNDTFLVSCNPKRQFASIVINMGGGARCIVLDLSDSSDDER